MRTSSGARRAARAILWFVVAVSSLYAALFLGSIALIRAMHSAALRDRIRSFNRRTLNPYTLRIAGNRSRIYAALHHTGRRTGRAYTTPVVAEPLDDGFIIPLPYGADVDWCRNVLAAGSCTLIWNGKRYELERPALVSAEAAAPALTWSQRLLFRAGGISHYLALHQRAAVGGTMPAPSVAAADAPRPR